MSEKLGYPYTRPRGPVAAMFSSPGPIYKLPPLVGEKNHDFESIHIKAPAYSFGHRYKINEYERSPGPAAYAQNAKVTNHGPDPGPSFSLKQRLDSKIHSVGPGPAQYLPNDNAIHPRAPEFQFGLRPEDHTRHIGPGKLFHQLRHAKYIHEHCFGTLLISL